VLILPVAFAQLPSGAGSHAAEGIENPVSGSIREGSIFETLFDDLSELSVGTFTETRGEGEFDSDWVTGEDIYILYDETTFNTVCVNTYTVLEFYNNGFVGALSIGRYGVGSFLPLTTASASIVGEVVFEAIDKDSTSKTDIQGKKIGTGSWTLVEYIWCDDPAFSTNNPEAKDRTLSDGTKLDKRVIIQQPSKLTFAVRSASEVQKMISGEIECTRKDGNSGDAHCEDNNVVQDVIKDCETTKKLVEDCRESCVAGTCTDFDKIVQPGDDMMTQDKTAATFNEQTASEGSAATFKSGINRNLLLFLIVATALVLAFALTRRRR